MPEQPNYIPPRHSQPPVTPYYNSQPLTVCIRDYSSLSHLLQQAQQDGFRNITSAQFERGHDTYQGNSMNDFNYDTTETLRIGAPPPWNGGEYAPVSMPYISSKAVSHSYFHSLKPQFPYGHFGQGGINHTGLPFVAEPLSNFATNLSHPFPGTSAAPSNQGTSPIWKLSNCWVGYEAQDELHLTIVFRKVPFM